MTHDPTTPALELRRVVKRFGRGATEVTALDDIDLAVATGELTAGEVLVHGRDVSVMSPEERATLRRRDVGYVFQRLNLIPSLSAVENVMLPLELDGVPTRSARSRAMDALAAVGLYLQLDRYPDDFSGGQQQRIAIARSLVAERRLLLADEPTGALDTASGDEIIELLARLAANGTTAVVLVTHEPRFASWADRVVFLRDGRVVDESRPALTGAGR